MKQVPFTPELELHIVRLAKDQERIRIAFDTLECLESMVLFRGGDHGPRMQVMKLLKEMDRLIRQDFDDITYLEEDDDE